METSEDKISNDIKERKENSSNKTQRKRGPIRLSKIKYDEKIVQIKRVTKVTTGGKKNDISCNCYYWR